MITRRVATDSLWNFAGLAAPLVAAAWAIPVLLERAGPERFGMLSLILALIGTANLLDLGLGKALAREGSSGAARPASAILVALGILGGGAVAMSADWIGAAMPGEGPAGFRIAALAIPAVTLTAGLRGLIEGRGAFRQLAVLRAISGSALLAIPAIVAVSWPSVPVLAASLVLVRLATLAAHVALLGSESPQPGSRSLRSLEPMFRFAAWLTAGTIASQVMITADRYIIGATISAAAVAAYAIPMELASRLQLVPSAIVGVLFPALSRSELTPRRELYRGALLATATIMAVPCLALAVWPVKVLRFWLGSVPESSIVVLPVLAVGTWINSCANMPLTWLHAQGRTRLTAVLHAVELPLCCAAMAFAIPRHGIEGAAWVWTLRVTADAAVLFWLARETRLEVCAHAA
jgi:O-antigen/teichoic acid export membrane protein